MCRERARLNVSSAKHVHTSMELGTRQDLGILQTPKMKERKKTKSHCIRKTTQRVRKRIVEIDIGSVNFSGFQMASFMGRRTSIFIKMLI